MLLFYTGSDSPGVDQRLSERSLGGYVSSTIVPNGIVNNVFGSFTSSDINNNKSIVRVIALKNLTSAPISGITIYPTIPSGSFIKIALGVAQPFFDINGFENYENLLSDSSLPYMTTFDYYTQESPLVITQPLVNGSSIAIYIKRDPDSTNIPDLIDPTLTGAEVEALIEAYSTETTDNQWTLTVGW